MGGVVRVLVCGCGWVEVCEGGGCEVGICGCEERGGVAVDCDCG